MRTAGNVLAATILGLVSQSCSAVDEAKNWTVPHSDVSVIQGEFAAWWAGLQVNEQGQVTGETLALALPSLVGRIRAVLSDPDGNP